MRYSPRRRNCVRSRLELLEDRLTVSTLLVASLPAAEPAPSGDAPAALESSESESLRSARPSEELFADPWPRRRDDSAPHPVTSQPTTAPADASRSLNSPLSNILPASAWSASGLAEPLPPLERSISLASASTSSARPAPSFETALRAAGVSSSGPASDAAGTVAHSSSRQVADLGVSQVVSPWVAEHNSGGPGGNEPAAGGGRIRNPNYDYTVAGKAADAVRTPTSGGLALVGGSTDVDAVFTWMGAKANGGDFLVLAASSQGNYNRYIDKLAPGLDSVATLIVPTAAGANDPFVATTIRQAEAIFLGGGDQSNYINFWKDTPLELAIYDALARNVPLGGTSAGLAVLGEFDFAALNGSITSSEALPNPYDARITLDSGFLTPADAQDPPNSSLKLLEDVITDSHFMQRDRFGRLMTFLGRLDNADGPLSGADAARGIGINEQTALLVEPNGIATVIGNAYARNTPPAEQQRAVYFLEGASQPALSPGQPLTYSVQVVKADYNPVTSSSDSFDLASWMGLGGTSAYSVSAAGGILSGPVYG